MKAGDRVWYEGKRCIVDRVEDFSVVLDDGFSRIRVPKDSVDLTEPVVYKIEKVEWTLREDHRIKRNVDYALASKYGDVHILCADVFEATIREVCAAKGIEIKTLTTWSAK